MALKDQVGPQKGFIPNGVYVALITEVKHGVSSKGTPFTTISMQIAAPAEVKLGSRTYATAGQEVTKTIYFSEKSMGRALEECTNIGVPNPGELDTYQQLQEQLSRIRDCYVGVEIKSTAEFLRESLTPEDLAAGKKPWDAPLLKEDGQPIVDRYNAEVTGFRPGSLRAKDGEVEPF